MKCQKVLFASLLFIVIMPISSYLVRAEYGCQSGFVPVYQGNRQVCVADYNLPVWQQQGQQQQQQPAEIWEDRYGAVANDPIAGKVGSSYNEGSYDSAKEIAIKNCGTDNCDVISLFRNMCTAAAYTQDNILSVKNGKNEREAKKAAFNSCKKNGAGCKLLFVECSLPVRVH